MFGCLEKSATLYLDNVRLNFWYQFVTVIIPKKLLLIVKAQSAGILSIFQTFDFNTFTATVCLEKVLKNIYFDALKMADFQNGIIDFGSMCL